MHNESISRSMNGRGFFTAIAIAASLPIGLALAQPAIAAGEANATVEIAGNPQSYTVQYDEQSGQYQDVEIVKHAQSTLSDPVEALVRFGGTCEPGTTLQKSELSLIPSSYSGPDLDHQWSGQTNYDHVSRAIGGSSTQHFKVLEACNDALAGKSGNASGVVEAFTLWQVPLHEVEHELTCSGNHRDSASIPVPYNINCGPAPAPVSPLGAQNLSGQFTVTNASATLTPRQISGVCPVNINLAMTVESTGAGVAKFIVETPEGQVSQEYSVQTNRQGNKYVATVNQPFAVPQPETDNPGGGMQVAGGGFTASAAPDPETDPGLTNTPTPPGHYSGSFRVKVKFPNVLHSDWVQYQVQCTQPGVAGADGFTQPANPTHGGGIGHGNQQLAAPGVGSHETRSGSRSGAQPQPSPAAHELTHAVQQRGAIAVENAAGSDQGVRQQQGRVITDSDHNASRPAGQPPSPTNPFVPEVDDEVLVAMENADYTVSGEYIVVSVRHRAPIRLRPGQYRTRSGRTFSVRNGRFSVDGSGDPDRPVVIGTVPNSNAPSGLEERRSDAGQPAASQPQQTDYEFLRAPASRTPDRESGADKAIVRGRDTPRQELEETPADDGRRRERND